MRGHDLINTILPDELILEIFGHLEESKSISDSCSLVCKRWLKLERLNRKTVRIGASNNPDTLVKLVIDRFVNVRNIYFDERLPVTLPPQFGYSVSPRICRQRKRKRKKTARSLSKLHYLAENSGSEESDAEPSTLSDSGLVALTGVARLEKLSLVWCSSVTCAGLQSVAEKCRSLRSLDLQGCYVGDKGLAAVGKFCKQLEDINLRFCEGLTDAGLVDLAAGCGRSLKSLGVAACARITDTSVEAVGRHCTSLQTLSLDSEFIMNKGIVSIAEGCPSLKVLKLQCINVTDEALQAVGTYSVSLELLALYSFQRFTDKSLFAIGKGCKKLKNLTLSDCYFLSDKSLEAIGTGCSRLTHLEINGCHNIGTFGLESIGKSCPGLLELALLYCQRMGNQALLEVGRGCKLLQALHLVDCSSIGDDAICSIADGCRNLKKLHIRRCYQGLNAFLGSLDFSSEAVNLRFVIMGEEIGDKGLVAIGERCKYLTDLSVRFCDRVGNNALIAIGQGCPLQHLNVSGCHQIGDAGIIAIARGCPQLAHLDVSVLQNITDMALAELGEGCPSLKDVVLSHCSQVTDVGLSHLVNNCTRLETCHMVYCPHITSAGVATIVSSCVNLKKLLVEKWKVSQRTRRRAAAVLSYLCIDL